MEKQLVTTPCEAIMKTSFGKIGDPLVFHVRDFKAYPVKISVYLKALMSSILE